MTAVEQAGIQRSNPTIEVPWLEYCRMPIAENFRRRGKFEDISFIFPNAPVIPITVVSFQHESKSGILMLTTRPIRILG